MQNKEKQKRTDSESFAIAPRGKIQLWDVYQKYIMWKAMPMPGRIREGLETQQAFAEHYKITARTLQNYQLRPDFWPQVRAIRKDWAGDRTPTVINAIYLSSIGGGKEAPQAQKLWMQIFEDFSEKTDSTVTKKVELGVNDIRFLIEQLPEKLKKKHYASLRELLDDAATYANRDSDIPVTDADWTERSAEPLSGKANNDAPNVPDKISADALAKSHQRRLRDNVVGEIQSRHNQSTERGW